jgi:hypothetical protein
MKCPQQLPLQQCTKKPSYTPGDRLIKEDLKSMEDVQRMLEQLERK